MKNIRRIIGIIFIAIAIIFILADSFIVISDGSTMRDILNIAIPNPPIQISYIPFIGGTIGFLYQYISLHGLIGIAIAFLLYGVGVNLATIEEKNR